MSSNLYYYRLKRTKDGLYYYQYWRECDGWNCTPDRTDYYATASEAKSALEVATADGNRTKATS